MNNLMTIVGVIGAGAFAVCTLPQLIKSIQQKSTSGISMLFIVLSIIGNIFSAAYVFYTNVCNGSYQYPLYANYGTALSILIVLFILKLRWK